MEHLGFALSRQMGLAQVRLGHRRSCRAALSLRCKESLSRRTGGPEHAGERFGEILGHTIKHNEVSSGNSKLSKI